MLEGRRLNMKADNTEAEILNMERKYWDAMQSQDIEAAVSLTKFPCTIASPKGVQRVNEADYRKMMSSSNGEAFKGIELQNPQVEVFNYDAAMISYSIKQNGVKMLDVSTWVREHGHWVCAFHSENPLNANELN